MPKLYRAEIQIIGDDNSTEDGVIKEIESHLSKLKYLDLYVTEAKYYGDIEDMEEYEKA